MRGRNPDYVSLYRTNIPSSRRDFLAMRFMRVGLGRLFFSLWNHPVEWVPQMNSVHAAWTENIHEA